MPAGCSIPAWRMSQIKEQRERGLCVDIRPLEMMSLLPFKVSVLPTASEVEHCFLILNHVCGGEEGDREVGALNTFCMVS